jgi:hypothetical protein
MTKRKSGSLQLPRRPARREGRKAAAIRGFHD